MSSDVRIKIEKIEKLIDYFLLLYLKYENKNKNGKVRYENEHELTKYR